MATKKQSSEEKETSLAPTAKGKRLTAAEKEAIIADWQASGKSLKEYGEEKSIPYPNLINWKKKHLTPKEGKKSSPKEAQAPSTPIPATSTQSTGSLSKADLEAENQRLKILLAEMVLKMHDTGKINLLG